MKCCLTYAIQQSANSWKSSTTTGHGFGKKPWWYQSWSNDDPKTAVSYRPNSLTSCLGKTMEKIEVVPGDKQPTSNIASQLQTIPFHRRPNLSRTLSILSSTQKAGIIRMRNPPLSEANEATYLGVIVGKKQTWKPHPSQAEGKEAGTDA